MLGSQLPPPHRPIKGNAGKLGRLSHQHRQFVQLSSRRVLYLGNYRTDAKQNQANDLWHF